jgi:DnaJ-domain-containing protein 1
VGLLETPGIRADVPIWGIDAGNTKVFFFPEAVLVYRHERYEGVSYESLEVALSSARFYEKDTVPKDAQVVAERTTRSRMPVVLYAVLEIGLTAGLKVTLQVSSQDAAARFARAFGVEEIREEATKAEWEHKQGHEKEDDKRTRAYYDSLTMKEKARIASAYATLGVKKGASMSEISAAYKDLARVHHPDKVAMLKPEEREASERRMKEINSAYAVLKRVRRDLTGWEGT